MNMTLKRRISMLLCLIMVFAMIPTGAFATEGDEQSSIVQQEIVEEGTAEESPASEGTAVADPAAQELLNILLGFSSKESLEIYMNSMSAEQKALMDIFTYDQTQALSDHMNALESAGAASPASLSDDGDENSGEQTGDQTGEDTGDQTGEETGDQTGEDTGDQTVEETGNQTGEETGDQTGDQTDTKTDPETEDVQPTVSEAVQSYQNIINALATRVEALKQMDNTTEEYAAEENALWDELDALESSLGAAKADGTITVEEYDALMAQQGEIVNSLLSDEEVTDEESTGYVQITVGNKTWDELDVLSAGDSVTTDTAAAAVETVKVYQLNNYNNLTDKTGSGITASIDNGKIKISTSASTSAGTYYVEVSYTDADGASGTARYAVYVASSTSTGNASHLEVKVFPTNVVTVNIDGEDKEILIGLVTQSQYDGLSDAAKAARQYIVVTKDNFTITATQGGSSYTGFTVGSLTNGNGSQDGSQTVKLTGTYPVGTYNNPVVYNIKIEIRVLIDKEYYDATLSIDVGYWYAINDCPGTFDKSGLRNSNWQAGKFVGTESGIDVAVTADQIGNAITKGKLKLEKKVVDESGNVTASDASFRISIQHTSGDNKGKYATFTNNSYAGASDTVSYVTVTAGSSVTLSDLPVGTYKITEIQTNGYTILDADGNAVEGSSYTVDYVEVSKDDSSLPVVTFTNMKLENKATISIAKTASGLDSYPNPTVSIYLLDDDGNKTDDAVWSGTLTANGDRLYLTTLLASGTYIIEETGHTVDGYNCTTTLTGGATVDGLKFTVVAGNRYDLTVNNVYEEPKLTTVTITKTVTGNMGDYNKDFTFTATLSGDGYTFDGVTYSINEGDDESAGTGTTCEFTLKHGDSITFSNLPIGASFTVEEDETAYATTVDGEEGKSKTVALAEINAAIAFVNTLNVTIDTGISLETMPYILILVVVVVGAVLLLKKRRNREED